MLQANELELALDVYNQLVRDGCTPNLVTYNILIDVHGKTGQWHEAIKVLDALESQARAAATHSSKCPRVGLMRFLAMCIAGSHLTTSWRCCMSKAHLLSMIHGCQSAGLVTDVHPRDARASAAAQQGSMCLMSNSPGGAVPPCSPKFY